MPDTQTDTQRPMTEDEAQTYLQEGAGACPLCRGMNEGGSLDFNGNYISQRVTCVECGAGWYDHYRLVAVDDHVVSGGDTHFAKRNEDDPLLVAAKGVIRHWHTSIAGPTESQAYADARDALELAVKG